VKKTLVICLALLFVAGITAFAQDNSSQTITINGGKDTVYVGTMQPPPTANPEGCVGFYDNICGGGYQGNKGWKVSDGKPLNYEWSPASQFTSLMSGTTTKITLGVGYLKGTNAVSVVLTQDCAGTPCTDPDGQPSSERLCMTKGGLLPKFGKTSTKTKSFPCKASLQEGQKYWVILQSGSPSYLGWNLSNSATGPVFLGEKDVWYNDGTQSLGAMTIQ